LIQNITLLEDVGDLPYSFLAPILRHIQNPAQLKTLEDSCPQLVGETGEIWLRFIKRDIPDWDKKAHQPRDPKNWAKVYKKLKRDAEAEKAEQEEKLRMSIQALQKDKSKNQTIIDDKIGYSPAARARGFGFRAPGSGGGSSWGAPSGAPAKTGKVAFDKLRRGMFDQKMSRPKATRMPAHLLAQRKGTVAQAPARLVRMNEHEPPAPSKMVLSKGASASVVARNTAGEQAPPARPTLQGLQFNGPKIRSQTATPPVAQKRKREEPNMFHSRKK
jgi:elongin-A